MTKEGYDKVKVTRDKIGKLEDYGYVNHLSITSFIHWYFCEEGFIFND